MEQQRTDETQQEAKNPDISGRHILAEVADWVRANEGGDVEDLREHLLLLPAEPGPAEFAESEQAGGMFGMG